MRRSGYMAVIALALVVVAQAAPAAAHVKASTGYSLIRSHGGGTVDYELLLEYSPLVGAAGLGEAARSAPDDGARTAALVAGREPLATYIAERVQLFLDGVECESSLGGSAIEERDGAPFARLDLTYRCPGSASGRYVLSYEVFSDADAVVDDHVNIVDYQLGDNSGRAILDRQSPELVAGHGSTFTTLVRFARLGFEHLVGGLDHVLFVVALALGARSLTGVLKVASMFTLAHSLTLALAVLGWVHVPAGIVEPLIALSIAYVAVENLLGGESRSRLPVVFAFGLLHGLGFAGAMSFAGDLSWPLLTSLAGFNIGIEIAQSLLLLALFPLVIAVRRFRWSMPSYAGATSVVAVFGLLWFAQRLSFS